MDFRAYARQAADQHGEEHVELEPASEGQDLPHTCSYCGAPDFENPTDNGRVTRVTCSACGGTMISHGGTWQPDLIGQPDNHPKQLADPGAAGDEGRGIPIRVEDLSSRSAAVDWCRHRYGGHCWIPRHAGTNDVALYIPQDRGACPWITEQQQMINCPVSEPGPMAGMTRAAAAGEAGGRLLPVKEAGYKGYVEAYHGHEDEMKEMDSHFGDDHFDESLWERAHPPVTTRDQHHMDQHGDYPESFHERHEDNYAVGLEEKRHQEAPVGHHTPLINFIHSHGTDHEFWNRHAKLTTIDHSKIDGVYATQPYVVDHHLKRYLNNRDDTVQHVQEHGHSDRADEYPGTHHPMWVKHEGNHYAIEGHHRTASDMLSGRPTKAFLFDADKHGFPSPPEDDMYDVEHHGLRKYAAKKVHRCDYGHLTGKKAREHAVRHHDDGICTATEARGEKTRKKLGAFDDPELRFHLLAAWRDVRAKAKRIRSEGGVAIVSNLGTELTGHVNGDTGVYETQLNYVPGTHKIGFWLCGCAWASYSWGRSPAYRRFEGRMCSHALALQYEAQSRGMFGRTVDEDTKRPDWMRDKVRVRHDRETKDHDLRSAALARLDPDGVYPDGHDIELERAPVHVLAAEAREGSGDPADALKIYLALGVPHSEARGFLSGLRPVYASAEPEGPYFHGTRHVLKPGQVLTGGHMNSNQGAGQTNPHVHYAEDRAIASVFAEMGYGTEDDFNAKPRVYQVHPLKGHEPDPLTPEGGAHRATHVRVLREVPYDHEGVDRYYKQGAKQHTEPTHAGVALKAADTGRVLMIQRSNKDESDPARGTWEIPGGGREPGDHNSLMSAVREFEEEVGQPFPLGGHVQHVWQSPNGIYQGHVVVVPSEDCLDFSQGRSTTNPDDPDGDDHEQSAWWHPDDAWKNPALRPELKTGPWDKIKTATLRDVTPSSPLNDQTNRADRDSHIGRDNGASLSSGHPAADLTHHVWGHLRRWVACSDVGGGHPSTSGFSVADVLPVRTQDPMGGVVAGRVVAGVPDLERTGADAVVQPVPDALGGHHAGATAADQVRAVPQEAVSRSLRGGAGPGPAVVGPEHDHLGAVSLFEWDDLTQGWHESHLTQKTSDYGAHDALEDVGTDWRPKPPPKKPDTTQENPGSTGWATSGDPDGWDGAVQNAETLSLNSWGSREYKPGPSRMSLAQIGDLSSEQHDDEMPVAARAFDTTPRQLSYVRHNWDEVKHEPVTVRTMTNGSPMSLADGHHRWTVAVEKGEQSLPVRYIRPGEDHRRMGARYDPPTTDGEEFANQVMDHYDRLRSGETAVDPEPPSPEPTGWALQHDGELHQPSEPALPSTTADDDAQDVVGTPGEQYRDQMIPQIDDATSVTPNDGRTAGMSDAVARFQASAAGKALASGTGAATTKEDTMDIAQAARDHVASRGGSPGPGISATAVKQFNALEQQELIQEGGSAARARNFGDLKIAGTHYEDIEKVLAQHGGDADILFL